MTKQEFIHCALCGGIVKESESHNAEPLCEGRCCSKCNAERVLPERHRMLFGETESTNDTYICAGKTEKGTACELSGSVEDILMMTGCVLDAIAEKLGDDTFLALVGATIRMRERKKNHV